jgi:acyl-coenzyme A thioesterase PaaI-like protein
MTSNSAEAMLRKWATDDPERVIGRGHPVGDFLDAFDWKILERSRGCMRIRARMPERVMNPRGDLFGGFTPTYVDFFGLHVFHTLREPGEPRQWLNTIRLDVEYFAPIRGPEIEILGETLHRKGRTAHLEIRFEDDGALCALAHLTLLEARP